jgi:hypothetical protein
VKTKIEQKLNVGTPAWSTKESGIFKKSMGG